jgi:hypothetical protein
MVEETGELRLELPEEPDKGAKCRDSIPDQH